MKTNGTRATTTVEIVRKVWIRVAKGLREFHTDQERDVKRFRWYRHTSSRVRQTSPAVNRMTVNLLRTLRVKRGLRNNLDLHWG